MSELFSILLRLLLGIIDGIMGIFGILHWSERHLSKNSHIGESQMDREARSWQEWLYDSWQWIVFIIICIGLLVGGTLWLF